MQHPSLLTPSGGSPERAGRHVRQCSRGAAIFHDQESHTNEVSGHGNAFVPRFQLDPQVAGANSPMELVSVRPRGPRDGR